MGDERSERSEKQAAAQQAVDILHEISTILASLLHPNQPALPTFPNLTAMKRR